MTLRVVHFGDIAAAMGVRASPEVLQTVVVDVMAAARSYWIQLAKQELKRSRQDYVAGIQQVEVSGGSASVSLVGFIPNMVEDGQDPYDMHTTLLGPQVPVVPAGSGLKGKHALKNGAGFWRVVPFRHQTPGTQGKAGGTPMDQLYEGHEAVADAKALGKAVYAAAKALAGTTGAPGGKVQWGGRLPAGMAPKAKPHHTTDLFAGMVRVEKEYENAKQSTYVTFRIISDAVPDKWQHPGVEARNLAERVEAYVEDVAVQALQALFDDSGG